MRTTVINLIKLNIDHRKKFVKLKANKNDLNIFKILIKFNIIKFIKINNGSVTIFFNYSRNKSFFKLQLIKKSTKHNSITYNDFRKNFVKNKQILIISTDKGFMSTAECSSKKIGGIPVLNLTLNS